MIEKIKQKKTYLIYIFLIVTIWLLSFEEPAARLDISLITMFRNILPFFAILLFLIDGIHTPAHFRKLFSPFVICGAVFAVCGLLGYFAHNYQNFNITIQTMYEHLRFWICIYLFIQIFKQLPMEKYAKKIFFHIAILSSVTILACILDMLFFIWPRQMYRYGTSSLQIFYSHPSNLAAHAVFLISMLCMLYPFLRHQSEKVSKICIFNLIQTFLLLGVVGMTLRVRMFGFIVFFLVLYIVMIVFRKKLSIPVVLIGIAGAFAVGYRRFYDYYFSPYAYTMARGQFAINSLDIAKQNLPFGSGFGTFGSRMAQLNYSPLYYKYNMMTTIGLTPTHPAYACDTFFPCILAESGWFGFIAYFTMIILLIYIALKSQQKNRTSESFYAVFTALILVAYELLETTGALAFSETYSVLISIVLGFSLLYCSSSRQPR